MATNGLPDYAAFLAANKVAIKPPNTAVTDNYDIIFDQNMAFLEAAAAAELTDIVTTDVTHRSLSEFAVDVLKLKQAIIQNEKVMLFGDDFHVLKELGIDPQSGIITQPSSASQQSEFAKNQRGLVRMALEDSGMKDEFLIARQNEIDDPMVPG